ncbi:deleted in lung and esophageal cancer protein 1-like isoform X2 [Ostrea edulis]|uniref:deleted in lung and esophageal cancer protein 1-like isoform X2 n=1 Tax=Ostrea edulis TaxID=37623 RepID=UPI0024AF3CF0|nr:deleted in lung and esophageal cancer protein 1-like isoform X2 [Ostrea edulis]
MKPPVAMAVGGEPPMFLQRPSTGKSQDVRHILAKTFRQLYTRDTIGPDTVKNLSVSKGGDDEYHERYVEQLQKVFHERQRRLDEAAQLERHIMQAQARAMSADERELNRVSQSCDNYSDLGLPPVKSHFNSCLDAGLLKKHKLLTPEDYSTQDPASVTPPTEPLVPSYARETVSSQQRNDLIGTGERRGETPLFLASYLRQSTDLALYDAEDGRLLQEETPSPVMESLDKPLPAWKVHLSEEQREIDRTDLANLQAKVNFRRNPRHVAPSVPPGGRTLIKDHKQKPKEIGIQQKEPSSVVAEPSVVFLVSPPIVRFTDYKVGQVYEITLELKNVSSCLRQCRAMPPSSPFFSIGLGQFPGEHGLVAPGMSCHYGIRFAPDSLMDYDDEIRIQTQSSDPIIVPLQSRRQPPLISLPKVLDVGHCLVGGVHIGQFIVKNEGGSGRFCVMPRSSWPATNFKSVVTNGSVQIPPFDVRPSMLELMKGDTGVMEVVFAPHAIRKFTQEITIVCDNCQVKHFTLKGEAQKAEVELINVERGLSEALPGELSDVSAENLIRFDELNPFTYTDKTIVVKNITDVELPFQWMIYKPDMTDTDELDRKSDRVPDVDSVFSVHPPSGMLPPTAEMEFKITFAPPVVDMFHSVLHLLLQQVPPYNENGSAKSAKSRKQSMEEPNSSSGEETEDDEETMSEMFMNSDMKQFKDVTALEIEVKGKSVPLNVVLHPYAVYSPGQHLLGTTVKKLVTMANHSRSTVTFQWQPHHEKTIIEMEPPFGELDPGMAMDLELSITGSEPGKVDKTLYCYVMNLEEPLHLHVEAEFKGPEIAVEEPNVDFGLVRLGESATRKITLSNLSQIVTIWSIQDVSENYDSEDSMAESEFTFTPSGGELKPLEQQKITIQFKPSNVHTLQAIFEVQVEDGNKINLAAFGEVQTPAACFLTSQICMEEVYKRVPVKYQAILINQTLLPVQFSLGQVEGDHSMDCSVDLDISSGWLDPREEKAIAVNFLANREGEFSDLRIPCMVEGMESPLYLGLFSDVRGLSTNFRVSTDGYTASNFSDDLHLDFGEVKIGSVSKLYLHIRNESAITAPYSISVEYFSAKPPTPPQEPAERNMSTGQRRALLQKTPNLADPMAKTSAKAANDAYQVMLSQNLGAAFVPSPPAGTLIPFGEEIIDVTAYCDMWGRYSDVMTVKVGDMSPLSVPISMTAVGCPLKFQLTAAQPEQKPIIRFGTHVSGVAPTNRTMRVNNTSPFDLRLDWNIFNVEKDDKKTVDLIVTYGEAFPRLDNTGKEIVPPWEVPVPVRRQPSDFLPNSPSTSAGSTRTQYSTKTSQAIPTEAELMAKRLPIISLFCQAHEGVPGVSPYSVKTRQLVIPARGHANVNFTFTPFPTEEVVKDMDCEGFALGYMSLDKGGCVEGKVERDQGYSVEPLKLEMMAHIKPALLTIECHDDEGMRYRSAMSDLLQAGGQVSRESLRINTSMLSNNTETPLVFRMMTKKPFMLVDVDPSTNEELSTRTTATQMQTLRPNHNLIVQVAFQTSLDLLPLSEESRLSTATSDKMTAEERKLEIQENLIIEFNNTTTQRIPLCATLSLPQMELSHESLDFGTCLVGQRRELQITIYNRTASHSYWISNIDTCSDTCSQNTFCIEPNSGTLEAHITHISNSKTLLKVYFTAKHAEMYEGVYVFHGQLGEEPRKLYLFGQGSYDGKHEAILNV